MEKACRLEVSEFISKLKDIKNLLQFQCRDFPFQRASDMVSCLNHVNYMNGKSILAKKPEKF